LPSVRSYQILAQIVSLSSGRDLILVMAIKIQNANANHVPIAPNGARYGRSFFLSMRCALMHWIVSGSEKERNFQESYMSHKDRNPR
jgi:hypothetical protein